MALSPRLLCLLPERLSALDHLIKIYQAATMPSQAKPEPAKRASRRRMKRSFSMRRWRCFPAYGFRGATVDQIARAAGLSKPNLLYYFRRKDDIYMAVLEHTLADWLAPLQQPRCRWRSGWRNWPATFRAKLRSDLRTAPRPRASSPTRSCMARPMIGRFLKGPLQAAGGRKGGHHPALGGGGQTRAQSMPRT